MKHNTWITSNNISKSETSQVFSAYGVGVRSRVKNSSNVQNENSPAKSILPEKINNGINPASTKWISRKRVKVNQKVENVDDNTQTPIIGTPTPITGTPTNDIVFFDKVELNGVTDGVNHIFGLPSKPDPGSEHIYLNGQLLYPVDYTITGASVIFNFIPFSGAALIISYRETK